MLIKDVIDSHENSDMKIPHIDLDVMKNLGNNCYVVSDDSQETIMLDINQKESEGRNMANSSLDGKRIRIIKPQVTGVASKVITPSHFKVIEIGKSKRKKDINPDEVTKYEKHVMKKKTEEGTTLNDTEKNIPIPQMSIFTTSVRRKLFR